MRQSCYALSPLHTLICGFPSSDLLIGYPSSTPPRPLEYPHHLFLDRLNVSHTHVKLRAIERMLERSSMHLMMLTHRPTMGKRTRARSPLSGTLRVARHVRAPWGDTCLGWENMVCDLIHCMYRFIWLTPPKRNNFTRYMWWQGRLWPKVEQWVT